MSECNGAVMNYEELFSVVISICISIKTANIKIMLRSTLKHHNSVSVILFEIMPKFMIKIVIIARNNWNIILLHMKNLQN